MDKSMAENSAEWSDVYWAAWMGLMWVGQLDASMVVHSGARSVECWVALTDETKVGYWESSMAVHSVECWAAWKGLM